VDPALRAGSGCDRKEITMSRINGEKARAAVEKRRRAKQREASLVAKNAASASGEKRPGGRPMAARHAKRSAK